MVAFDSTWFGTRVLPITTCCVQGRCWGCKDPARGSQRLTAEQQDPASRRKDFESIQHLKNNRLENSGLVNKHVFLLYRFMDISNCDHCRSICHTLDTRHEHWSSDKFFHPFAPSNEACGSKPVAEAVVQPWGQGGVFQEQEAPAMTEQQAKQYAASSICLQECITPDIAHEFAFKQRQQSKANFMGQMPDCISRDIASRNRDRSKQHCNEPVCMSHQAEISTATGKDYRSDGRPDDLFAFSDFFKEPIDSTGRLPQRFLGQDKAKALSKAVSDRTREHIPLPSSFVERPPLKKPSRRPEEQLHSERSRGEDSSPDCMMLCLDGNTATRDASTDSQQHQTETLREKQPVRGGNRNTSNSTLMTNPTFDETGAASEVIQSSTRPSLHAVHESSARWRATDQCVLSILHERNQQVRKSHTRSSTATRTWGGIRK